MKKPKQIAKNIKQHKLTAKFFILDNKALTSNTCSRPHQIFEMTSLLLQTLTLTDN